VDEDDVSKNFHLAVTTPMDDEEENSTEASPSNTSPTRVVNVRRPHRWLEDYEVGFGEKNCLNAMLMMVDSDPVTFREAVLSKHWREAMASEIEAIEKNHTCAHGNSLHYLLVLHPLESNGYSRQSLMKRDKWRNIK